LANLVKNVISGSQPALWLLLLLIQACNTTAPPETSEDEIASGTDAAASSDDPGTGSPLQSWAPIPTPSSIDSVTSVELLRPAPASSGKSEFVRLNDQPIVGEKLRFEIELSTDPTPPSTIRSNAPLGPIKVAFLELLGVSGEVILKQALNREGELDNATYWSGVTSVPDETFSIRVRVRHSDGSYQYAASSIVFTPKSISADP